jgi:N6-L-threonylcarbamoyladenine synthase
MTGPLEYELLGRTRDDAAGEALDKIAKFIGLGYPGGPVIEKLGQAGDPKAFAFAVPRTKDRSLDFSFSGLKTAAALIVAERAAERDEVAFQEDLAASFQAAVVDVLVAKSMRAVDRHHARALCLGGGVACNLGLRDVLGRACAERGVELRIPSPRLCADNAAMVALIGTWLLESGEGADDRLDVAANLEESGLPMLA